MNDNRKRTWKNLIHKIEVNLHTNLHFQFVYYLVLGLKISSHASRAQKASYKEMEGVCEFHMTRL